MSRHFLSLGDYSRRELEALLERATELKRAGPARVGGPRPLEGKQLGLLFEKPSLRTRVTFEVGMRQLGGDSIYLGASEVQLGVRESVSDVARNLERWLDGIVLRTFRHETVEELARFSSIPVINGLTDLQHPCQIFSDLLTILEKKGRLEGVKIAYIGDGNNVANSWLQGASIMGMDFTLCTPKDYGPDPHILREEQKRARKSGARIRLELDPARAAEGAEVLYTDVWTSMGKEREAVRRKAAFRDFQINRALLDRAAKDAIVMHCLPAHRGEEITDDVMDGPQSVVFDQAENRLHAQKAILEFLMSEPRGS